MSVEKESQEIALGNALIIEAIFSNLSTKDLLRASVVNKFWNYEARCVLRDQKKCVAVINGGHPCVNAKKLNETVGSLNVKFFNGLALTRNLQSQCLLTCGRVEEAYENLLRMPWKYLETEYSGCMTEDCVLGQFISRLMSRSFTLEQLIVKYVPEKFDLKEENRPEGEFELPKLKTIEIPEHSIMNCPKLLPTFLAGARSVEELHTVFSPSSIPLLPAYALKMVKKLQLRSYGYVFLPSHEETMRSLNILGASEAKLSTVIAEGQFFLHINNQMIHDYCHRLISIISSHSETLRELKIDSSTIYCSVLANHFPQVLKNVENLTFEIYQGADPGIARYLLKLPLAQIFPNVKSVKFSASGSQQRYIEIENDDMLPWPAVKEVKFEDLVCSDRMVEEIGLLFPNLCCLEISFLAEDPASPSSFPFRKIWSTLPFLEKLTVRGKLAKIEQNFDAEFCGIHPEEAADLQKEDDEFLKAVNIVPPFPPITHMKSLKRVEVEVGTYSAVPAKLRLDKNTLFLSKVTERITYGQVDDLDIRLLAPFEVAKELDHLKSFVKLDLLPPDPGRVIRSHDEDSDGLRPRITSRLFRFGRR